MVLPQDVSWVEATAESRKAEQRYYEYS